MTSHPTGVTIDIVGIECADRGRSCEEHAICGAVLTLDTVVRIRSVQIEVEGKEEAALAVYWVTDGIDRCRVGFLPRHLIKHKQRYNGKLAQVVEVLALSDKKSDRERSHRNLGIARAAIINATPPPSMEKPKRQRDDINDKQNEQKKHMVG